MKKIVLMGIICWSGFAFSQITSDTKKDKLKAFFTYGINFQVHDDYAINSKLNQVGLPELKTTTPELFLGMTFFWKKIFWRFRFWFFKFEK